jgi:hypothetical protein
MATIFPLRLGGAAEVGRRRRIQYTPFVISRGVLFTRLFAAVMPVCLLWTFAACLSICADHVGEAQGEGTPAATVEVSVSDCADDCPVTGTTAPVPVKRFALDSPTEGTQAGLVLASHVPPAVNPSKGPHPDALKPPDTPFKRLRTLRI